MKRKPNFIIIVADDMGYGDCGCFGSKEIRTPHIDRLAREGIRFTDFHANGPVCSPTRAALLTGRYQQRCGIEGVLTAAHHRDHGLPLEETTFAEALKPAGYRTALFGKWHVGYEPKYNPVHRGFDEFNGFVSGNVDYFSHIDQTGVEDWWCRDALTPEDGYTTDLVTKHGARFIEENKDQPFCLYLAHECPHFPYQGPSDAAYRTPGNPEPIKGPREDQDQAYQEMMESMDAGIGTILDTVQACGIDEQTLVMFFSDNGPSGPGSAGPLRGQKGTVYEGGHRVPAAARWPGTLPAGTVTEVPCMGMDLFPTMTRLANVSRPEHPLDGIDLFPLMARGAEFPDRPLFWRYGENIAVREGRWKLVLNRKSPPYTELFDLETDLSETKDLTLCHPEVVSDLLHKLRVWETDVDQSPSQLPSTS